ncbi:MAG: 4Fe-4S dicluster domain-containing protein, partial [Pseudomonadota bacterium]
MSEHQQPDPSRRRFMGEAAAAIGGLTVAPGIFLYEVAEARPADQAVTDKVRWGILVDTNQCGDGCDDCVKACSTENGWQDTGHPETDAQWIRKVVVKDNLSGHKMELPMMCQHCETAPCVDVCPTGASFKRADGIVLVDKHICIGCRYCMMACPYKARSFIHEVLEDQLPHAPRGKGTVESCTMCVHRVDRGERPASVEACDREDHKALVFGDLNDPSSEISQRLKRYGGT